MGRLKALSRVNRYRLPTEADWEQAARSGMSGDRYAPHLNAIDVVRHRLGGGEHKSNPVGWKPPNACGLYDMLGNVSEWVQDWYGRYSGGSVTDPRDPNSGSQRVVRDGDWLRDARYCRAPERRQVPPDSRGTSLGFRLLRIAPWQLCYCTPGFSILPSRLICSIGARPGTVPGPLVSYGA